MRLTMDNSLIAQLFPAHLIIDKTLRIRSAGPSLLRHRPCIQLDDAFSDHFIWPDGFSPAGLPTLITKSAAITIKSIDQKLRLSGSVLATENFILLALRHTPEDVLAGLRTLQFNDFAADDPMASSLLLRGLQQAMIEESRNAAIELAQERDRSNYLLERISRVAGFMAHDFNNCLSIITLSSARLLKELPEQVRSMRLINIIRDTAQRGSEITRSLMTLSQQRYDSGQFLHVDDLILENESFFSTILGAHITLRLALDSDSGAIHVSKAGLINCLANLLINGRDAMPDGGSMTISTSRQMLAKPLHGVEAGCRLVITVSDTGCGMSEAVRSRAFEPLFSTKANSAGIGLASVRDFVRSCGGETRLESQPGQGTSIHLYLRECARPEPLAEIGNPPIAVGSPCIILVEDEPFALEALTEILELEGLSVVPCDTPAKALEVLHVRPCNLLVSDVIMPGMNGVELAYQAQKMHPAIKVILMSGYVPQQEALQDDWQFMRKPLDPGHLLEMVHAALLRAG